MKLSKLAPGMLVNTPDGVGIVVKSGVREVAETAGMRLEPVTLIIVSDDPKWYNTSDISQVKSG